MSQTENLEVDGAIKVTATSNMPPEAGTIQWNGTNFEGYDGDKWVMFGSHNPEFPTDFSIDSVVLDSTDSFTVPAGKELYLSELRFTGALTVESGASSVDFNGYGSYLDGHLQFALGENMKITNGGNFFKLNGFLTNKKNNYVVIELSTSPLLTYTVPPDQTLVITNYRNISGQPTIDGKSFFGIHMAYSGQTLGGDMSIVGYLK